MIPAGKGFKIRVEVQNSGQVASKPPRLQIVYVWDEKQFETGNGKIPKRAPYKTTDVELTCSANFDKRVEYNIMVIVNPDDKNPDRLHGKITPVE